MQQSIASSSGYSKEWKNDTSNSLPALRNKLKSTRVILSSPKKSSTPSANEPILGFGSQASRVFDSSTELPSPGTYYTRAFRNPLGQSKNPSFSNLGYASGFVSMDPRERSCSYIPPNPATKLVSDHYDIPRSIDVSQTTMNWQGHTYPFLGEPQDRVYFEEFSCRKEVPGPAFYSPDGHYDSRGPKFQRHIPSAGYNSMTNRRSHIHAALQSSNSPGPGMYLNSDYAPRPETPCSAAAWTRSHTPRFASPPRSGTNIKYMSTHSQEIHALETTSIAITPSTFVRARSAGANYGSKGKLFESPSSPIRFFGSEILKGADNPRSFLGNLIEKSDTPGPGAYVLRPATSSLYMTRAQGSRVQDEASVFKSLLPNHPVIPKKGPGPAWYKPKPTYSLKIKTKNPRIKFLP